MLTETQLNFFYTRLFLHDYFPPEIAPSLNIIKMACKQTEKNAMLQFAKWLV